MTYKAGTAGGPQAIVSASRHVELFDPELGREFHEAGIATYPAITPADSPSGQFWRIQTFARPILGRGQFLLALGGEHSITAPLVELASQTSGSISVLQIDAHADLRDSYDGTPHSHACVMRRILEITDRICQVGVRSFSKEEYDTCPEQVERFVTPEVIRNEPGWIDRVVRSLGQRVYVTIDMDGLDPAIAPGVGTPEPDGLTWHQVASLLRTVCAERHVVAADIVEVRPIPPNHVTEFLAARLACKLIAYTQQ